MNYFIFIPLSALIVNVVLITAAFVMGRPRKAAAAFILFESTVIAWEIVDIFTWLGIPDKTVSLLYGIFSPIVFSTGLAFMNFIYILLRRKRDFFYRLTAASAAAGSILVIFTDLYVTKDIVHLYWGIAPTPGPLYMPLMIMMFAAPLIFSMVILWRASRTTSRRLIRAQLKLLFWGAAVMFLTGFTLSIVLPFLFGIYDFPRIASAVTVLQSIFVFTAMARYRFLSMSDRQVTNGMLQQIEDGIILLDADFCVIEINRKARELLGLEAHGPVGAGIRDILGGFYPGELEFRGVEIVLENDGRRITVTASQFALKKKNNPIGILIVLRDVTSQRLAEEARVREFNFKEAIINSSPAFICALDPSGRTISMNNSMLQALGYLSSEVEDRNFLKEFVPGTDREAMGEVFQRITGGREQTIYSSKLISSDGRELTVEWHGRPVFDAKGELGFFILVGIDITERQKMEEELIRTHKLEALGVFAGGIAHDFNNLLAVMTGNISIAMLRTPGSDTAKMLAEIEEAAMRAKDLTQQLLVFSKGGDPVMREASIRKLLIDTLEFVLRDSNTKLEFDIPEDLWTAKADTGQIRQVVKNLAVNSMEAMDGSGMLTVTAENFEADEETPRSPLKGKYIRICLRDSGRGIADKDLQKIYDPYFSTKPGSQGLGLSIATSILKKHGGHINAESVPGQGTLFEIFLPAAEQQPGENATGVPGRPGRQPRVLLMDDEELIRSMGSRMLEHLGCESECAQDGAEAVERYRNAKSGGKPFDLVIMDLTVPSGMGGLEAVKILLEYDRNAKVVVSSGYSNDPVLANFKDFGFSDVLTKPYRVNDIDEVLRRLLD